MLDDENIVMLSKLILCVWPSTKAEVQADLQPYWSFVYEIAIIDCIAKKQIIIIIPAVLQDKALNQFEPQPHGN